MNKSIDFAGAEGCIQESIQETVTLPVRRRPCVAIALDLLKRSKYLLFQEKCRVCQRFIHPELAGMDLNTFRPPATCAFEEKEVSCESICRVCWLMIQATEPVRSRYELIVSGGEIDYLTVTSAVNFTGEVKSLIYKFKYDGDLLLARDLALLSLPAWQKLAKEIDLASTYVIPVPLHPSRLRQRGFNQSELLAKHLSRFFKIKLLRNALTRVKKTSCQQALGKQQRMNNVRNAFRAYNRLIEGKHMLLLDDVLTSGATLMECAKSLREAGAASTTAFTIARVEL